MSANKMDTSVLQRAPAYSSDDELSTTSELESSNTERWTKISNGGTKRKKNARCTATNRKRVVQKPAPKEQPAPSSSHSPANSPAEFNPQVLVINAPQWEGAFSVMIALSTEYPTFKMLTRRGPIRTLIRPKDQVSQDTLLNIKSLQQKPVSFIPQPATKATVFGIVQRVPLAVPTALLMTTTPTVLEAARMSVWSSAAKAA